MNGRLFRISTLVAMVMAFTLISGVVAPALGHEHAADSDEQDIHLELNAEIDMSIALEGKFYSADHGEGASIDDDEFASFQEHLADFLTVFSPDNRQRITPTTHFPASAITLILNDSGAQCSGTFIGSNVVLTAAHCLYDDQYGIWMGDFHVIPAADGQTAPFGYQTAANAWVPGAWAQTGAFEFDVGLLLLPDSTLGNQVGWYDLAIFSTQTLSSPTFNPGTAGYPGDKPDFTMWMTTEPAFVAVNDEFLFNRLDTYWGQSGSSVWRNSDGYIAGVQVGGNPEVNIARRINEDVIAAFLSACSDMNCSFNYAVEQPTPPPPPPPPEPDPPPPPPVPDPPAADVPVFATGPDADQATGMFNDTRGRTDHPVEAGQVNRTWMWGPHANSAPIEEPYAGAPGNSRVVTYFDKSRMEDNSHRAGPPWNVTNGLLVVELISGQMQVGDNDYVDREPASVQVAGDDHPDSPTYAMLDPLRSASPLPVGTTVTQRLNRDGSTSNDGSLGQHGVTATHMVPDTNHTVASVFWDFMNSSGTVFVNGSFGHDSLFENPFFATGFPITEPYWVHVPVGGQWQDVLLQCFERRCLTYTPGNPSGWQVEAGNVGQHYYRWRYGDAPAHP